jgi:tRNA1(Val) A37 N6-methylase TrmN6
MSLTQKQNTQEIFLLGKALRLQTLEDGFQPGLDSVMLAAACPIKQGQSLLDMGCGIGSAGLCVLSRVCETTLSGIDIQTPYAELATHNAQINGFEQRAAFASQDVRGYSETGFDHVICNPPYLEAGAHIPSPDEARAIANGQTRSTLEEWIKTGFNAVKSGGSLSIIHRADTIHRIIQALGKSFGATEIIPLWPKSGVPAKRVIIRAIKHRKTPALIHPGIVIHKQDGTYTDEAEAILREGQAL